MLAIDRDGPVLLKPGKLADLVILSIPGTVDSDKIAQIEIVETIKVGVSVCVAYMLRAQAIRCAVICHAESTYVMPG